jgi:hypothetical protein
LEVSTGGSGADAVGSVAPGVGVKPPPRRWGAVHAAMATAARRMGSENRNFVIGVMAPLGRWDRSYEDR